MNGLVEWWSIGVVEFREGVEAVYSQVEPARKEMSELGGGANGEKAITPS
jgi:hypothetical protein